MSLLIVLLLLTMVVPAGIFYLGEKKARRFKNMLAVNIVSFFSVLIFTSIFMFSTAFAAETAEAAAISSSAGMAYLAAALSTGLGSLGAGIATGQAASSALGALSENDSIMGKALIFVALAEGIAIYGILIAVMILGRV